MTEAEWRSETEPTRMWNLIRASVGGRKRRLFAVECAKRAVMLNEALPQDIDKLLALIECVAEAGEGASIPDEYYDLVRSLKDELLSPTFSDRQRKAVQAAIDAGNRWLAVASGVSYVIHHAAAAGPDVSQEYLAQADLLRCVVPFPFRPVALDPAWLTSTVVALAQGIYGERAFDRMPILADALQDAGCENADVLDHCRDPQQVHVRGCWVVDLVLGLS